MRTGKYSFTKKALTVVRNYDDDDDDEFKKTHRQTHPQVG